MGLNASDDREMLGGIAVSQVWIERFRSRDRPPSLLSYTEDHVNNTDDKAVAACLHCAAMKKLIHRSQDAQFSAIAAWAAYRFMSARSDGSDLKAAKRAA